MFSVPHVGQWCEANATSDFSANISMASKMYRDQARASRTCAPRNVYRLCRVCVVFSAMHSARRSGK